MVLKGGHSHSTCYVQHTALLCFINSFSYYICINTDMKTTAIGLPLPAKASVMQQGLKVGISAWYLQICQIPCFWHKTESWLPSHLSVAQPGPHAIKYWLLLQGLMPHSHTQAQGTMHYHRRKMPSLCLHSILYRDQHQGRLLTVKK